MAGDLLQRGNAKAVVFIDTGIADWQTLINAAPEGADIVTLDPSRDGLEQMAQWAQTHSGYDAIHIISHGSEGQIHLGNFTLDASAINTRASDLAQLGAALNEEGDLLLYGCEVASGEGQDFIAALAQATQADVAASDDLTGAASLGGDWELESSVGEIGASLALSADVTESYAHLLVGETFGFESSVTGLGSKTVTAVGKNATFTIESESANLLDSDSDDGGFTDADLSGSESIDTGKWAPAETKLTFSIDSGKQFDLSSLMLQSWDGDDEVIVLTSDKGSIEFNTLSAIVTTLDIANHINADFFKGISSFTLTENTLGGESSGFYITFDDLVVTNITAVASNAQPTITGAPSDITVTEDTASNVDLSDVTLADSNDDNLTVTLTASAGTLAASSGGSVTVSGSGTGVLTLAGTAANINTYLDTTTNIQYTGASNASGDNAATLSIKVNDGTVDSSTTTVNLDIAVANDVIGTIDNSAIVASTDGGVGIGQTFTATKNGVLKEIQVVTEGNTDLGTDWTVTLYKGSGIGGEVVASQTGASFDNSAISINDYGYHVIALNSLVALESGQIYSFYFTPAESIDLAYVEESYSGGNIIYDNNVTPGFDLIFKVVQTNADPANAAPTITGAPSDITVTEDTVSNVALSSVTFADADGDTLTATLTASAGTLAASSGGGVAVTGSGSSALTLSGSVANINTYLDTTSNIQYTGASNASGDNAATLTIKANDGTVDSSTTTVNVDITAVNDAPVFTSSNKASVAEKTTAVTTLVATDADGDTLTYSISGGADQAVFSLDSNSGVLTFTNAPDFEAPGDNNSDNAYDVEVTANDGQGGTTPLTLTVTVTDTNEAPTLTGATKANVSENSTGTIYTATGSDPENNTLTYALSGTDAALFDLNANSGALSFKNAPDYEAPADADGNNIYSVNLTANDGSLNSAPQALLIRVTNVDDANAAPVFTSSSKANVAENSTAVATLMATDADGDTLTYSISGGADQALFSLDSNSGALTFINAPDFEVPGDSNSDNAYAVEVTANDGQGTTPLTLTVNVTNANEGPTLSANAKLSVPENTTGTVYTATASDPENAQLFYTLSGTDAGLFNLDTNTGALSFKNAPDYEAPADADGNNIYSVNLTANDGSLNSAPQALLIRVTNVDDANAAPVFTSSSKANVAENSTAVATLMATDADGDTLTYSISGGADQALFSLDSNSGALTFINAPDFEVPGDSNSDNAYAVEVTANDGQGTSPLTLTVNVTNTNEAPTLTGATKANVSENSTGTIYTVTASDPENNPLTYALSGIDAALFDLNANSGALSFKTAPDFEAPGDAGGNNVYDVILTANDGSLNSTAQALAITVSDVNETQPTPTPEPTPTPPPIQVTPPEPQPNTPSGRPSVKETITNTGSDQATTKLVENSGNANEVTATLPGGVSLVNQGARTAVDPLQALGDLVNSIGAQQPTNLNEQTGVASQWLTNRPQGTLLDIRTLVISESGSSSITTPVQITGIGNTNSSHQEAFVIDVRLLPQGNRLQLDNIDFASIIGETMITGGAGANVIVADDAAQMIVLGEDDDELHAGGGRDLVGSKGGDDLIFGEAGYDRLFGGEGNDVLNGGSGVDVARFTIDAASAELRYADDGSLMVSAGELGTDTLISVELLRFNDQVVLVDAPTPQSVLGFDEKSYLATNSDVAMAVARGDFESGIAHYAQHGRQEGRRGELNGFDEAFYLAQNPDVAAAVSRGEFVSGFHHYMRWGDGEGRDPNALFDEVWYRAQNTDVNRAIELGVFDNAYEHYLAFGNAEQRLPSAWFDTADYLATHQDVAEARFNPVLHYLSYGVNEGRVIVADDAGLWG